VEPPLFLKECSGLGAETSQKNACRIMHAEIIRKNGLRPSQAKGYMMGNPG